MQFSEKSITHITTILWFVTVMFSASCDTFVPEVIDNQPEVSIKEDPIVIYPNQSSLIDLNSLVSGANDDYRISITTQPKFGTLYAIGDFILEYIPNSDVTEARDAFVVSVLNNNNIVIDRDSVIIIITPDPIFHPCQLQATNDYTDMLQAVNGSLLIDVLANDTACGIDPAILQVSVFSEDSATSPKFGSVTVLADGRLQYTPFGRFFAIDVFYYKVTKPADLPDAGDTEQTSIGMIYVDSPVACTALPQLQEDTITIPFNEVVLVDSLTHDTTYNYGPFDINIIGNDTWCADGTFTISIERAPVAGGLLILGDGYANYEFIEQPLFSGFQDNFSYKVCTGGGCDVTEVVIILQ
jgi:hypothetical protein